MTNIYDWKGAKHTLTHGAFDSKSLTNPNMASVFLHRGLERLDDDSLDVTFHQLGNDYLASLKKDEPGFFDGAWKTLKTKLPELLKVGGKAGSTLLMSTIRAMAGANPSLQAIITSSELVIGNLFDTKKPTFVQPRTGQWLLIESERSHNRRLQELSSQTDVKPEVDDAPHPKQVDDDWNVGFWLNLTPGESGYATVYDVERRAVRDVRMAQLANVPPQLAQKLDGTETVSALRELFLIKRTYDIEKKTNPDNHYYPGKLVFYKDDDYRVVASDDSRVVLVNDRGKVHKVSKTDLTDTYANRSTPGQTDNYFVKDSHSDFSAGTWVWVEARSEMTRRYQADYELAMFVMENQGQALIFFALDGMVDAVPLGDVVAATKDDQVVFNSDKKLFLFREFALRGDQTNAATHSPNKGLHAYIRRGKLTKSTTTRFKVEPEYDYAEKEQVLEPAKDPGVTKEQLDDDEFHFQKYGEYPEYDDDELDDEGGGGGGDMMIPIAVGGGALLLLALS